MIFPRLIIKWERWKFNKELGIYVSNMGNFKTAKKKPITPKTKDDRYLHIKLPHSGYVIRAHVAVMKTWKPLDSYEGMTVDHIDANHRNNELSNLEWVTKEENMRRAETNSLVTPKKNKKKTVKITVTSYTLDQFYLLADGIHFNSL